MRRAVVALVALSAPAARADVPYGADGLPYLAAKAAAIVRAGPGTTADPAAGTAWASVYRVRVAKAYRGDVKEGAEVRVVVKKSADVAAAKDLDARLLFLGDPKGAADYEVKEGYPVLGGRLGAVDLSNDTVAGLVEDYLKTPAGERLTWADKALAIKAEFLQRSAVLEAELQVPEARDRAIALLARAAGAKEVAGAVRLSAVGALAGTRLEQAAEPLAALARDRDAPAPLRARAIAGLADVKGGEALLTQFLSANDTFLSDKAKEVLDRLKGGKNGPLRTAPPDLLAQLKADDFRKQQGAAVEIRKYTLTKDVVAAVAAATADPKTDAGARLLMVETLGRVTAADAVPAAAAALEALARDTKLPQRPRAAALLALARLPAAEGKARLAKLTDLGDADLTGLAKALAEDGPRPKSKP